MPETETPETEPSPPGPLRKVRERMRENTRRLNQIKGANNTVRS